MTEFKFCSPLYGTDITKNWKAKLYWRRIKEIRKTVQKHTSGIRGIFLRFYFTPFSCDFYHSSTPVNYQKLETHSHMKIYYSNYNNKYYYYNYSIVPQLFHQSNTVATGFLSTLYFRELKRGSNNNCEGLKMASCSLNTFLHRPNTCLTLLVVFWLVGWGGGQLT